jgi:hypothetical protein
MPQVSHRLLPVLVLALGLVGPPPAFGGGQSGPPVTPAEVEPLPVPDWLAWQVFHDSLVFYAARSAGEVEAMLWDRAGLAPGAATALRSAGQAYLMALAEIDQEARAEVQARYGGERLRRRDGVPPRSGRVPASPPLQLPAGTTLYDLVVASGLHAAIETRRAAALAAHLTAVRQAVGAEGTDRLAALVDTQVRPVIQTSVVRPPAPDVPVRRTTRERP